MVCLYKIYATADKMPDVWVNLAHAYLVQGEYVPAIKLYQVPQRASLRCNGNSYSTCVDRADDTV